MRKGDERPDHCLPQSILLGSGLLRASIVGLVLGTQVLRWTIRTIPIRSHGPLA